MVRFIDYNLASSTNPRWVAQAPQTFLFSSLLHSSGLHIRLITSQLCSHLKQRNSYRIKQMCFKALYDPL